MIDVNSTDKLIFDLRLHQIDYNEQRKNALRKEIADKYGVPLKNVEINFIPIAIDDEGKNVAMTSEIIENIQNPEFQQRLFKEYVEIKKMEDVDIDAINAIDSQVNALVDFEAYTKHKSYKFKYVKWDNYLSYGKGNYFDFTNLNGLVLLNGQPENQCGKTTFAIDLLRFALFGRAQKSPTLDSVFNIYLPEATEVMVEAGIEIEGVDYVIRRTVTRPSLSKRTKKSKCKQKVEYYKVVGDEFESIDNCEGESSTETNNIIKESIGNIEDFNLVISATSYTLGDLLRMGQSDKGKLFSRWMGLLSIEKKEEVAKEMWKKNINPKLLSNTYDKTTLQGEIDDYNTCITEYKNVIKDENKKMEDAANRIEEKNKEKTLVLAAKKDINNDILKVDINTLDYNIERKNDELVLKRQQMRQYKEEYKEVKDAIFNDVELKELNDKVETLKENTNSLNVSNAGIKVEINKLKEDNKRIEDLMKQGKCPTCGQDIDMEQQTEHINENNIKINDFIKKGVNNKNKIDENNRTIESIKVEIEKVEKSREDVRKKNELELKMSAIKANIDNIKLTLSEYTRQKNEIETNKENIKYNNDIMLKVQLIDDNIAEENKIKENSITSIAEHKSDIKRYEDEIKKREDVIKKLDEEEKIIRNWRIYQELVGKNGITKMVLRRALPILNNMIATMLNGLCDFNVEISISDDNKVCMDLVRNGQRLDLGTCASGFETVMASIAVRHSLACIATFSKANFTVFDEVLDGVAVSNYENVRKLFERMSNAYDFVIHITHNELISDWHTSTITVTKSDDGISIISLK